MNRFVCTLWVLVLGCTLPIFSWPTCAFAQADQEFLQTRPFKGELRRDMAKYMAKTAAEIQAMEAAMRMLAKLPELQQAAKDPANPPLDVTGLAAMLYGTRLSTTGVQGFPPHVVAVQGVTLVPLDDVRKALAAALTDTEKITLYSTAFQLKVKYLAEYDAIASQVLSIAPGAEANRVDLIALSKRIRKIQALNDYLALLPNLSDTWQEPETIFKKLKNILEEDQGNPLVQTALAEVLLQLDRPAEALEYAYAALHTLPQLARAHDVKGAILLRQRLPALAVSAFSEAIRLAPKYPAYLTHRAAAYLVQEEMDKMCDDLREACVYGDCEGYAWAQSKEKCQTTPNTPIFKPTHNSAPSAMPHNSSIPQALTLPATD